MNDRLFNFAFAFAAGLVLSFSVTAQESTLGIVVSPETTIFVEPLKANGLPDFRRAMLERYRRDKLAAEQNGAVDFWQVVGTQYVDDKYVEGFRKELGIDSFDVGPRLRPLSDHENQRQIIEWILRRSKKIDEATDLDTFAAQHPEMWSEAQAQTLDVASTTCGSLHAVAEIPFVRTWLSDNEQAINKLSAAVKRDTWYNPPASLCSEHSDSTLNALLPTIELREATLALSIRALVSACDHHYEQSLNDIAAAYALQKHIDESLLVGYLVKKSLSLSLIGPVEQWLAHEHTLNDEQLAFLATTHVDSSVTQEQSDAMLDGEIRFTVAWLVALATHEPSAKDSLQYLDWDLLGDSPFEQQTARVTWLIGDKTTPPNWGNALATFVERSTLVRQRLERTTPECESAEAGESDAEFAELFNSLDTSKDVRTLSRDSRGEILGQYFASGLHDVQKTVHDAECRAATRHRLQYIALQIAKHRNEQGEYPQSLDKVELDIEPVDAWNNKPFVYKKTKSGYLLYSLGNNGSDDGGSVADMTLRGYDVFGLSETRRKVIGALLDMSADDLAKRIPEGADDEAIRFPMPRFPLIVD